jgi:hypothetical protein
MGGGFFMLLWLTGWTVGCVALGNMVLKDPKLISILFAIPFWASWVFVFCAMLRAFFCREYFMLNDGGAAFIRRVIVPIKTRLVPLEEIKSFHDGIARRDSESGHIALGVEMRTLGRPLSFAAGVTKAECDWLIDQLNECLHELRGDVNDSEQEIATPDEPDANKAADADANEEDGDDSLVDDPRALSLASTPREPPSDCRWERIDDIDSTSFVQRGRLAWGSLGGLLFVTLFWNGVVSVFIGCLCGFMPGNGPQGVEWWGLFVFLIPFEVIGLCILAAFLFQLFEPFRRTRWSFDRQSIVCRSTWFGLGPRWVYPVKPLSRLELQQVARSKSPSRSKSSDLADLVNEGANRSLVFIDGENTEFCSIKRLTEGEARWIGDFILRERPFWFE